MYSGRVLLPTPALKLVMTRSSNDSAKAIMPPAAIAGARSGSVTWRKVLTADAPRSRAASSRCGSSPIARARTMTATYDTQNVTCASEIWVNDPWPPKTWEKKSSRLMPMTISGVTIGSSRRTSIGPRQRCPILASPRPSSVPSATDARTATSATWSVTPSAPRISSFWNSVGYQSRVKPVQLKFRRSALKLKMIRMTIGRNRKT